MSAVGNPGGDSFCFLPSRTPVVFSLSCKNTPCPRTVDDYKKEYDKATKGHKDFFIEYSTGKYPAFTTDNLPNDRCGLVYEDNFQSYFGPFSGRAFILKRLTQPNINTASMELLQSVS